ncbi:MAG: hypothetical protein ACI4C4_01025 [Lachnospiraceae bacterium]
MIRIFVTGIVFLLFLHSIFSTSYLGEVAKESGGMQAKTRNIADSPLRHIVVFLLITVVAVLLYRWIRKRQNTQEGKDWWGDRILRILSLCLILAGTWWIMVTRLTPGSDPAKVYGVAMQWRDGDFTAFEEGNYLFCYPFQSGIVLFYYLLSFIFGIGNFIGLQFVNLIALVVIYGLLVWFMHFNWREDKATPVVAYLALVCWVPIFFYITYIYGILPGMACSLGAVCLAAKYLHTRKLRYMIASALCIGAATVLKMNCLIYLVAIACFMLYDAIDLLLVKKESCKKGMASVAFVLVMIFSVWSCNFVTEKYVEHLSGYDMPEGEVMLSWVVMGLQEAPRGPGNYNGYNGNVFFDNHFDTELANEQSWTDLKIIIKKMLANPLDKGVDFFARKTAYQWNDPTFISMERMSGRKSEINISEPVQSLIDGNGSVMLSVYLNFAQTWILAGMLLYLLLHWRSSNLYELMVAVVFLGGYLFHLVWEASASYTIPYFVLLIPYAVKGFLDWIRCLNRMIDRLRRGEKLNGSIYRAAIGIVCVCLIVIGVSRTNLFQNTIALDDGAEAEEQFYHKDGK